MVVLRVVSQRTCKQICRHVVCYGADPDQVRIECAQRHDLDRCIDHLGPKSRWGRERFVEQESHVDSSRGVEARFQIDGIGDRVHAELRVELADLAHIETALDMEGMKARRSHS